MHRLALRGDLLDFTGDPGLDELQPPSVRHRPAHWLLIEPGRIVGAQPQAPGEDWERVDHQGRLILPGFIDSHVHSAQLDVIGSWGTELLDWLDTYTFPAEQRLADPEHAAWLSAIFLDALLGVGTTTACVYPTVHATSVEALFEAAQARGLRLVTGKILMDRHAPPALCDDVASAARDCRALMARWHGRGRLAYAVTPRFAATSTPEQLTLAGQLLTEAPGLYLQTHVAENQAEVRWIRELFPQARSYLDVYDHFGLLGERTVLAHGIWLDEADRTRLAHTGAHIACCPSSNLFLGSGLFDWAAAHRQGVGVSLASDVGGGTSLCMRRTMMDGYKMQALAGQRLSAWALLHAATRGSAQALRLGEEIGSFEPGRTADLCVWGWGESPLARRRQAVARSLHERVFAWLTLAEPTDLVEVRIAGQRQTGRVAHGPGLAGIS